MDMYQRRRVAIAAVFTLAALPAVWLLDRSDSDAGAAPDAAGTAVTVSTVAFTVPTTVDEPPAFLSNTVVIVPPAVIDVARPEPLATNELEGKASFKRWTQTTVTRPCTVPTAPSGAAITITNIDNGLTATCTNTLGTSVPAGIDALIDTPVFTSIADLVDAPIFVRVSW